MLQKIIVFVVSFSLVFGDVVPNDIREDTVDTTKITNMPFGFYKEKMESGTYKVVDREDLSEYPNKRIFSGYGVFDIQEKNCKYIENNANKLTFRKDFEKIKVFNNNSFAVSRSSMTFSQCVALTQKYVGNVYAPASPVENSAVSKGQFLDDEMWVGMTRADCTQDYVNSDGIVQGYSNFLYVNSPCDQNKLYVYKKGGSTKWIRASGNEYKKCAIRIKTNDYLKPIKICAPWWRVESSFINHNKETLIWGGKEIDLSNFLMPDVPQRVTVCTERKEAIEEENTGTKRVTCKKYYSRTAGGGNSGQCLEEPIQPACEENECAGYIEHNCKKISQLPTFKDYTWGYIVKDGVKIRVKMKDKIKTFVYECPAENPSANSCLKREEIVIFPKECPGSQCDELRTCILSNKSTGKECKEQYICEKIYGDPSYTPVYHPDGTIKALRAKCKTTGEVIENDQIREMTYSKSDCLRYEEIEETNTTIKKCISTKIKTMHTLETSITEPDIYANDPECVRTNNIEDSRPYVNVVFDYINRGFFTTVIEKAFISGEHHDNVDQPDPINQLPYQISNIRSQSYSSEPEEKTLEADGVTQEECDAYFKSDGWFEKRISSLFVDQSITPLGILQKSRADAPYQVVSVVTAFSCSNAATKTGLIDVTNEIAYEDYPFAKIGIDSNAELRGDGGALTIKNCVLTSPPLSGDSIIKFVDINVATGKVEMSTEDNHVDEEQCQKYATCLGMHRFTSYSGTETKTCVIGQAEEPAPININPIDHEFQDFVETEGSIATGLDGTKDMIVIQEYAPGRFGYMSNYRFQLPKNNIVKINNKEIFPLISQSAILEPLDYHFDIMSKKQTTKNKEPNSYDPYFETLSFGALNPGGDADGDNNFGAAAAGGAGAAGIGIAAGLYPLASIGIGIAVAVIILFFAGSKRFGMIRSHWDIKKTLDPSTAYVPNVYGYDFREYDAQSRVYTYERMKFQSAMQKRGDFEQVLQDYKKLKEESLYFAGYSMDQINSVLIRPCERDGCVTYPGKIKWYKFSGKKTNTSTDNHTIVINKPVNNIYMGATNTVTVFVPYRGDYEIIALDKNKNILGKKIISDSDFIDGGAYKYSFAKVMFSLSDEFGLAHDIEDGNFDKACRYDNFVEWGGGVSGVYYENLTPDGHKCSKSNDAYVKDFSAHYIKFKAVDADKYFEVKLKRPMPYANRFFFVHLDKLETREYECYKNQEPCTP